VHFPGLPSWSSVDAVAAALLWPVAVWIVFSGLDDLFVDAVAFTAAFRGRARTDRPPRRTLLAQQQKPIAILVPLWREDAVIARMVQQNASSILYRNYHIFIGAYPNDEPTLREIRKLEARYPHVHLAVCPHAGPTSKADCLNWIFQNILAYEQANIIRFHIIVTHDAEDVIHSDSLHWINHYAADYEMVQVPVLPLRTSLTEWTHGIYIDEFTEYQSRDMPARQAMGAFIPSQGVGTGFRRDALDALALSDGNRIFEPVCLTEDYENGLRLCLQGARQVFIPLQHEGMATREYFPHTVKAAIRQRTRWVTGIVLQTWDRHGWSGGAVQKYWLWRDRKGLLGNPLSLLTNALFFYGAIRWFCGAATPSILLLKAGAMLSAYRLVYRMACVGRVFGIGFALTVPLRVVIANYINSAAVVCASIRFFKAKWRGLPLVWIKTHHAYPCQEALVRRTMRLGELLVANGYVNQPDLDHALDSRPKDLRLGEHLVATGRLDEDSLYEALSLQQALPQSRIEPASVKRAVARSLPARVLERHKLIPVKLDVGRLLVAGPEMPTPELRDELQRFTRLEIEFHLVTPRNYSELANEFLPV
jgi:bacteriophage N4 adsorption protein B